MDSKKNIKTSIKTDSIKYKLSIKSTSIKSDSKLKKFAMEIAKSTYITLRISLPLLQTLPSFLI